MRTLNPLSWTALFVLLFSTSSLLAGNGPKSRSNNHKVKVAKSSTSVSSAAFEEAVTSLYTDLD
ncbi:MAG TPA: hypothetical protein VFV08_13655, partial [Puia sp.]|nr:hypothetical protein [Puia sp.]